MTTPWQPNLPPAASEFSPTDHIGQLYAFMVGGYEPVVATQFGDRGAVRCSLLQLDGPEPGAELFDVMLFNQKIVGRLRGAVGQIHLGRFVMGIGRSSNNPPVELNPATPADEQIAMSYVAARPGRMEQLLQDALEAHRLAQQRAAAPPQRTQQPAQAQQGQQGGARGSVWQGQGQTGFGQPPAGTSAPHWGAPAQQPTAPNPPPWSPNPAPAQTDEPPF